MGNLFKNASIDNIWKDVLNKFPEDLKERYLKGDIVNEVAFESNNF